MRQRHQDWPLRLMRFIRDAQGRTFDRGRWDCALMVADWVRDATGIDYGVSFRGQYDDAPGAARMIRMAGGTSLGDLVTRLGGEPLRSPTYAQRGDVALVETAHGPTLGIVLGPTVAHPQVGSGLVYTPLANAVMAWRV